MRSVLRRIGPDHAESAIAYALCEDGWTRQFRSYPSVYFIQIDNRKGDADVTWSARDRIVRQLAQHKKNHRERASLQRDGGAPAASLGAADATLDSTRPLADPTLPPVSGRAASCRRVSRRRQANRRLV